jgi:serine/threonine protein kinase
VATPKGLSMHNNRRHCEGDFAGIKKNPNPDKFDRYDLTLRTGLKLKELVEKDARVDDDFFKKSWVIEPANPPANSNLSVYNLLDTNDKSPEASKPVFVNFKPFQLPRHATEPTAAFKKKVAHLARLLSYPVTPDGGFRTLQCIGLVRHDIPQGNRRIPQYAFVYDLPSHAGNVNHNFQTLTWAIASKTETRPTLGERFRLARALAETLFQFHSVNWLHKSVRSDNILLFRGSKTLNYSDPYLVGFEFSRGEGDQSTVDNDDSLNSNLYRHPRRQGLPDERFSILHDIYALGAVLLEIGVWRPLGGFGDFSAMSPDSIKDALIENGDQRLPHYMGRSYTDAVVACLEGSLAGFLSNSEQDQPLSSENRAKVQIAFWDRVIEVIEKGFAIT